MAGTAESLTVAAGVKCPLETFFDNSLDLKHMKINTEDVVLCDANGHNNAVVMEFFSEAFCKYVRNAEFKTYKHSVKITPSPENISTIFHLKISCQQSKLSKCFRVVQPALLTAPPARVHRRPGLELTMRLDPKCDHEVTLKVSFYKGTEMIFKAGTCIIDPENNQGYFKHPFTKQHENIVCKIEAEDNPEIYFKTSPFNVEREVVDTTKRKRTGSQQSAYTATDLHWITKSYLVALQSRQDSLNLWERFQKLQI